LFSLSTIVARYKMCMRAAGGRSIGPARAELRAGRWCSRGIPQIAHKLEVYEIPDLVWERLFRGGMCNV
jgi:hypothetical protein